LRSVFELVDPTGGDFIRERDQLLQGNAINLDSMIAPEAETVGATSSLTAIKNPENRRL
jgi:hypothetical protein